MFLFALALGSLHHFPPSQRRLGTKIRFLFVCFLLLLLFPFAAAFYQLISVSSDIVAEGSPQLGELTWYLHSEVWAQELVTW